MQDKSLYNINTAGLESVIGTNKVLKNTYMLLGMTLLFSAFTAGLSMAVGLGRGTALILSLVGFGLLFVVNKTADSNKGLIAISPSPVLWARPSVRCSVLPGHAQWTVTGHAGAGVPPWCSLGCRPMPSRPVRISPTWVVS